MTPPILAIEGIHSGYGEVRVLHGVSLQVAGGSITALLGSNGAGKTTLLRSIAGLLPATQGRILYHGRDITALRTSARVNEGIALVPEGRMIFADFTVEENLLAGAFSQRARAGRMALLEQLYGSYPLLRERRHQQGGTLSGGQQQILAIARGLMSRPSLLLLDEPSLGLAPLMVAELFRTIRTINAAGQEAGVTVLIVEQNVRATLELADQGYVLENGQIVLSGKADDLLSDDGIQKAYLGL